MLNSIIESFRLTAHHVVDIKFLQDSLVPTIAVLYIDTKEARHVKTFEINLQTQDFDEGPWTLSNVGNSYLIRFD